MYFTIEGCEYSGKSSVIESLKVLLPQAIYVKNPGCSGLEFCKTMRHVVQHANANLSKGAEMLCYIADRCEVNDKIVTKNNDRIVIGDREYLSTLVYQSCRGHFKVDDIVDLHVKTYDPPKQHCFVLSVPFKDLQDRESANVDKDDIESTISLSDIYYNYEYLSRYKCVHDRMNTTVEVIQCKNKSIEEISQHIYERIMDIYSNGNNKCL